MAQQHVNRYEQHQLSAERQQYFCRISAKIGAKNRRNLNKNNDISFEQYLAQYR